MGGEPRLRRSLEERDRTGVPFETTCRRPWASRHRHRALRNPAGPSLHGHRDQSPRAHVSGALCYVAGAHRLQGDEMDARLPRELWRAPGWHLLPSRSALQNLYGDSGQRYRPAARGVSQPDGRRLPKYGGHAKNKPQPHPRREGGEVGGVAWLVVHPLFL